MRHHADEIHLRTKAWNHTFNLKASLEDWIRTHSVEDIAELLAETPSGLSACPDTGVSVTFTPFQRLFLVFLVKPFFTITSSICISKEELQRLAEYTPNQVQRKIPIVCEQSLFAGAPRDVGIHDLGTGQSKTALSLAEGLMLLSQRVLVEE